MFCEKCGAGLREDDRFCSRCGAPVVRTQTADNFREEEIYREDKKAYRDSFLEKREEKSHALLVTVTVLLIMAVAAAALVILFFFLKKADHSEGNVIEILSASDGGPEEAIAFLTETDLVSSDQAKDHASGADEALSETEKPAADENTSGTDGSKEETKTEPTTESGSDDAQRVVDVGYIEQILKEKSDVTKAAVCVYDLNHNQEYATQGCGEPMYASALICVPILYTAAVKLDQGVITLNDPIPYVNSIGGRGEAYPEGKEGENFPLSYYLTTMMSYSDNNCMNCLIDYLGQEDINAACRSAGFESVDIQRKIVAEVTDGRDNYVSARDLTGMVRQLYQGKFQTIGREFIKKYFKIDSGDGYPTAIGLAANLPSGILFLNHNGKGDTRYNETAVIADDTRQYIISVMCNGDYGFSCETAIEEISAYVYDKLSAGSAD